MNLEIMMNNLSIQKMKQFFKKNNFTSVNDVTLKSGIDKIIPKSKIDAFQFEPCGYSMNGLLGESYSTIHITPEGIFSYVSYETNISLEKSLEIKNYEEIVKRVFEVFVPGSALVVLVGRGCGSMVMDSKKVVSDLGYKRIEKLKKSLSFDSSVIFEYYENKF